MNASLRVFLLYVISFGTVCASGWYVVAYGVHQQAATVAAFAPARELPVHHPAIVVVPHHAMLAPVRASLLHSLFDTASKDITTVIVLSPNHDGVGVGDVLTTQKTWQTARRAIPYARDVGALLAGVTQTDAPAFSFEHGVVTLMDDIADVFPRAAVVPLMVRSGASPEVLKALATSIAQACNETCVLVTSVDFSHEQTAGVAFLHDVRAEQLLNDRAADELLLHAEADSPEALFVAATIARMRALSWHTEARSHSGALMGDMFGHATVSHIIGIYDTDVHAADIAPYLTFALTGDVMFDRGVARAHPLVAYFSELASTFRGFHAVLVNHEGVITDRDSYAGAPSGSMNFLFPSDSARVLALAGVTHASLANNHTDNHMFLGAREGLSFTRGMLSDNGIMPCGGYAADETSTTTLFHGSGVDAAVICVNTLYGVQSLTEQIALQKHNGMFVVIYPHWGTEYAVQHTKEQQRMAEAWIDAGADMVVGSHPHVVEDVGVYKGKPIVYSLGNTIFDQGSSDEVQTGLLVGVLVTHESVQIAPVALRAARHGDDAYIPHEMSEDPATVFGSRFTAWAPYKEERNGLYTFPRNAL